jgi:hypothetical protein
VVLLGLLAVRWGKKTFLPHVLVFVVLSFIVDVFIRASFILIFFVFMLLLSLSGIILLLHFVLLILLHKMIPNRPCGNTRFDPRLLLFPFLPAFRNLNHRLNILCPHHQLATTLTRPLPTRRGDIFLGTVDNSTPIFEVRGRIG